LRIFFKCGDIFAPNQSFAPELHFHSHGGVSTNNEQIPGRIKMKYLLAFSMIVAGAVTAFSQRSSEAKDEAKAVRSALLNELRLDRLAQKQINEPYGRKIEAAGSGVTDADVGEAASFGQNAKFFGVAAAGFVVVSTTCDPADIGLLGPDDRCLLVTDPTVTTVGTFNDIGRIKIPGKKADNIIYMIANHTVASFAINSGSLPASSFFSYSPGITIESDALLDPAAIDPNTGLPMNGSFTTTGLGSKSNNRLLQPGEFENETQSYSRANTLGFSRSFFAALGLPANVINNLYTKPMTIKLNVTVRVRRVEDATILYSGRFLAN
jgi:hypothetical protein